jgi:hypothetical protein
MGEVTLQVGPAAGGWALACDLPLERIFFKSESHAMGVARTLAMRLTDIGRDVRVLVRDSRELTMATHRYFAI